MNMYHLHCNKQEQLGGITSNAEYHNGMLPNPPLKTNSVHMCLCVSVYACTMHD